MRQVRVSPDVARSSGVSPVDRVVEVDGVLDAVSAHDLRRLLERVYAEGARHVRLDLSRVTHADVDGVAGLAPQAQQRQGEFKASFTLPRGAAGDAAMSGVVDTLAATGTDFSLVRSSGVYEEDDLLDVLPPGATKASAVDHMARLLGAPSATTLFAGDSRNDLDPLLRAGRGIVVANAQPALLEALRPHLSDSIYLAERPHLHGVVDGCRHFGVADGSERRP